MPNKYVLPEEAAFLTNPEAAAADRVTRQDYWFHAKQRQGHPIRNDAGHRLGDLEARITGRPTLAHAATEGDPDPMPPAPAVSEVEAGRQRAQPAIFAAVARAMGRTGGDAA
ncbi:hypothetical protein [Salipiger profundus]|uniref:hypothetical protein n=1 Tax=Salipiger profundus TaxID=1229727 RepID=UPI0008F03EC6|nr:hypothetical protein [Salipiger profundus]SFC09284.1 hypothetical protein SAMN05444415_10281 [Salipiger profundus]